MSLKNRFRRLPPVCALVALLRILTGRLRFENRYVSRVFVMQDGQRFRAFRHMSQRAGKAGAQVSPAILVVRFKFARFPRVSTACAHEMTGVRFMERTMELVPHTD